MPAWLAFLLVAIGVTATFLSFKGNREAARTGRLRFLFWHIPGWGERDRNPTFFKLVQAQNHYRTFFFATFTIVAGAYFLEAIGVLY